MSTEVRLGIIGVGGMGSYHAASARDGKVSRCRLAAVCDIDATKLDRFADIPTFTDSAALIRSGEVDAVLIATPHYDHTTVGIDALSQGLHVLVEKPISVHKADCERLISAHKDKKQVFSAMFNQRTNPAYRKVRELVQSGELGEITRVNWIVTDWFRSEAYYSSGGWRATWRGEGGGVLLNQCPHQLDLLQWMCGMPSKVRAFCGFGMKHDIEVEDQVTAYLEYPNGATGVFITTTGEAPGTNRLEIAAERGRLVVEGEKITWIRNETPMTEFSRTTSESFGRPGVWNIDIPVQGAGGQHVEIMQNFVDAILDGKELLAPAAEGINSVELGNAMLFSTLKNETIELPMDGAGFEEELKKLIASSRYVKKNVSERIADLKGSF